MAATYIPTSPSAVTGLECVDPESQGIDTAALERLQVRLESHIAAPTTRGLGSTASPQTFGHSGVGTSYSWADLETGVSFTYLTNSQLPKPLHSKRMDEIATLAHAAVVKL